MAGAQFPARRAFAQVGAPLQAMAISGGKAHVHIDLPAHEGRAQAIDHRIEFVRKDGPHLDLMR
jgi:hypothetical protein